MSYDPSNPMQQSYAAGRTIDAGLQSFMQSVYHTMAMGLCLTGLAAFSVVNIPALYNVIFGTPLYWVVMIAPLAFLWFGFTPNRAYRMSSDKLRNTFIIFCAIMGLSFAAILKVYTGASVARAFFITAATFAGVSLYGYTTKRDLTGVQAFLFMGLLGIVVASLVNLFMGSALVHFIVSIVSVIVFTGLTAWETQNLKLVYRAGETESNNKMAVLGALSLYMSFINLFQVILSLTGDRK